MAENTLNTSMNELEKPTVVHTVQRVPAELQTDPRSTWKTKGNKAKTKSMFKNTRED